MAVFNIYKLGEHTLLFRLGRVTFQYVQFAMKLLKNELQHCNIRHYILTMHIITVVKVLSIKKLFTT